MWVGDVQYVYDRLGRVVQKGDLELEYGADGHVAAARRGARQWSFLYSNEGERLVKLEDGQPVAAYIDGGYLTDAGLDDVWQKCGSYGPEKYTYHDENGNPVVDTEKFPDMKVRRGGGIERVRVKPL